jgi:predicted Zn-dependent peptidase
MLARERFLNANDSTVVVIGGVDKLRVMRALRQLLGPWQRGDRTVPPTFRQPNPANPRVLVIDKNGATNAEIRLAVRGLARSDRDAEAASLLALIVRDRLRATSGDLAAAFARHEAHDLPGIFVLGATVPMASAAKAISATQEVIASLTKTGPTASEVERARAEMLADLSRSGIQENLVGATADNWLNGELYKLPPAAIQVRSFTLADIQRVSGRLFKNAPVATIAVGNSEQLKSSIGTTAEVLGAKPEVKAETDPATRVKKP